MTVLVTGGAGYIGSVTVEALRRAGQPVVVVDNLSRGHREAVDPDVPLYVGEVGDRALIRRVVDEQGVEACAHFAALAYVGESVEEPDRYYANNVGATVNLRLQGSAYAMLAQFEDMLRHYVPEIEKVQDVMDAIPKPGLETPTGKAVREVLDSRINPAVAGHGGHISLIDVRPPRVYLRLEGGCQGCGMADVTLKQGVEAEIMRAAPEINEILDVTEHAAGSNPYYQPGKGGASPMA